jgi:hypothetical protein
MNSRTESSSVISDDDSNQNGYYIDSNNEIYFVSSNGNTINLASATGSINNQRNECYLLKNNMNCHLKNDLLINVNTDRNSSSSFVSNASYTASSTSSTFTELQPASIYQLPSIDTLSGNKPINNQNEIQYIFYNDSWK